MWPHTLDMYSEEALLFSLQYTPNGVAIKKKGANRNAGYKYNLHFSPERQKYYVKALWGKGVVEVEGDTPEQALRVLYAKLRIKGEV